MHNIVHLCLYLHINYDSLTNKTIKTHKGTMKNIFNQEEIYSPKEAAEKLKVSKAAILEDIHTKRIKNVIKRGYRTFRIPGDSLNAYWNSQRIS